MATEHPVGPLILLDLVLVHHGPDSGNYISFLGGHMKTTRLAIYALCLILLTACGYDQKEMEEAWGACTSATGKPSGNRVSGKVYEIDSIDAGSPGFGFTEYVGGPSLLGYKYIDDGYKNLTKDLSKAGAVLCAEVKTAFFDYCNYPSDQKIEFTISYYHTEAHLSLLAWPSKELIAQTILTPTESFGGGCAPTVLRESDERFRQVYERVDLDGWLDQYVTITK